MQLSGGFSGSNVERLNGIVRKQSSYLKDCPDYPARRKFLATLSDAFPYMPRMRLFDDGIIEMDFITGHEGIQGIDFRRYGQIVRELHTLQLPAPAKDTGIEWLIDLAQENFKKNGQTDIDHLFQIFQGLTAKHIVHGEITQVITDPDQNIYIIDWDECGLGNRYQDLGFIYYRLILEDSPETYFDSFLDGYGRQTVDMAFVTKMAGLIAVAYSGFYDFDRRIKLGNELLLDVPKTTP